MIDSQQPDSGFDLTAGFGRVVYALSLLFALGGGLVISSIYLTFIDWGASSILYEAELVACLVGLTGLLLGLIFVRSKRLLISKVTVVSSIVLALLGAEVLASTVVRDGGKTNISQVSLGLLIPILLTAAGAFTSYFKLDQINKSTR